MCIRCLCGAVLGELCSYLTFCGELQDLKVVSYRVALIILLLILLILRRCPIPVALVVTCLPPLG